MYQRYLMAATFLGIAACATSGNESQTPGAAAENLVLISNPTAAAGESADEGKLEDVDVPEIPKVANMSGRTNIPDKPDVICRREKPTGSNMARRVCRRQSEIEEMRTVSQDTLKELQRQQGLRK